MVDEVREHSGRPEPPLLRRHVVEDQVRRDLAPCACTVLDAPDEVRDRVDVWGPDPSALALMRRLKDRFDPAGVCNPGRFVGGI